MPALKRRRLPEHQLRLEFPVGRQIPRRGDLGGEIGGEIVVLQIAAEAELG